MKRGTVFKSFFFNTIFSAWLIDDYSCILIQKPPYICPGSSHDTKLLGIL